MAGELNGRDGQGAATRRLRVAFATGTGPAAADAAGATGAVVEVDAVGNVTLDGTRQAAILTDLGPSRARLLLHVGASATEAHQVLLTHLSDRGRAAMGIRRLEVVIDGWRYELDVDSDARARLRERATIAKAGAARGGPSELRAIIPGRVVSVDVAEGDAVEPGGRLLVLEAMKMQNELKAPRAGTVVRVAVGPGQNVELGDLLVVLE